MIDPIENLLLRHEVDVQKVAQQIVRTFLERLAEMEPRLYRLLRQKFDWIATRGYDASDFTLERLQANIAELRSIVMQAYAEGWPEVTRAASALGGQAAEFGQRLLVRFAPGNVGPIRWLEPGYLDAIRRSRPFKGRVLRQWGRKLGRDAADRIEAFVRDALADGKTTEEMVRGLRGTKEQGFRDGIMATGRREAAAIAYSASAHMANHARDDLWQRNSGLVKVVRWTATLDLHTCPTLCLPRDGLRFRNTPEREPVGHNVPWLAGPGRLHPWDRCTSIPEIEGVTPPKQRAAKGGPVTGGLRYIDWLKRQPPGALRAALGPERAAMFLRGEQKMEDFWDTRGQYLSLEDLRRRDAGRAMGEVEGTLSEKLDRAIVRRQRLGRDDLAGVTLANIQEVEARIITRTKESAMLFDSKGDAYMLLHGNHNSVDLGPGWRELRGGSLTHNHPSGPSFSPEDFGVALDRGLAEVRAIGVNGLGEAALYSARPGKGGWPSAEAFGREAASARRETIETLTRLIREGEVSIEQAEAWHWHVVWSIVAKRLEFLYERVLL
jgi:hypothetical protein